METTGRPLYPEATLFHTQVHSLTSSIVGQDYTISIWLPDSYTHAQKTYPVVYLLDGNFSFGLATDTTHLLIFGQEVPEVMLVGIGYPIQSYDDWITHRTRDYTPTQSYDDWVTHRTRDYTPTTVVDTPGSGGAAQFLSFIETELLPFVESTYRTDPTDRTLWGYSLGGLFVLYALFTRLGLFHRYVSGSPYVGWDNQVMFQYEQEFARGPSALPADLAITAGTLEEQDDYKSNIEVFWTRLQERNYAGLNLKTLHLEGETHLSGFAPAYIRGLKAVFSSA